METEIKNKYQEIHDIVDALERFNADLIELLLSKIHGTEVEAELDRLRKIEVAAREFVETENGIVVTDETLADCRAKYEALKAALEAK